MYEIKETGEEFQSFTKAIEVAAKIGKEVFEVETGLRRWAPAPKVNEKKMRQYHERLAVYKMQEEMKK